MVNKSFKEFSLNEDRVLKAREKRYPQKKNIPKKEQKSLKDKFEELRGKRKICLSQSEYNMYYAMQDKEKYELRRFIIELMHLVHMNEDLWVSCGKAEWLPIQCVMAKYTINSPKNKLKEM